MKERVQRLEDLAFHGGEMPQGLSSCEQALFLKFRLLYTQARAVQMPPEQGKREKQAILEAFLIDQINEVVYAECNRIMQNTKQAVEAILQDEELQQNKKVQALLVAIAGESVGKGE